MVEEERIPFWRNSEDRDSGKEPDYYMTQEEIEESCND